MGDVYAIKAVGFKPIAMALVKLHVYNDLMKYDTFIANIEFRIILNWWIYLH